MFYSCLSSRNQEIRYSKEKPTKLTLSAAYRPSTQINPYQCPANKSHKFVNDVPQQTTCAFGSMSCMLISLADQERGEMSPKPGTSPQRLFSCQHFPMAPPVPVSVPAAVQVAPKSKQQPLETLTQILGDLFQ